MKYIGVCTPYLLITNVYFVFVFTAEGEDNWSSICGGHQHGWWAAEHCASHRGDFSRDRPSSTSGSSLGASTKKAIQEEERLLSDIVSRGEQSMSFQSKVLEMLAPPKAKERTVYADWAKEVIIGLHPSLWLKFQRECSNLLYSYQEKSAQLLHSAAISRPTAVPDSAAIFCPSLWHPAAVPSLPQRLTKHLDYQRRMAASSPLVACSRPARPVRVGITGSPLGAEPDEPLFWPSSDSTAAGHDADDGPARCPGHQQHPIPWRGSLVQSFQLCGR